MICPFCGKHDNPSNARFCSHCGTALLANHGFAAPPAPEPATAGPPPPQVDPVEQIADVQAVSQIVPPDPPEPAPEPQRPRQDEPIAAATPTEPLALSPGNATSEPVDHVAAATAQEPGPETVSGSTGDQTPPPGGEPPRVEWVAPRPAEPSTGSRYWAAGAHASAFVGAWFGGIPAFVGPLVVWLMRKDNDPFAAEHSRNALNFNLSVLVYVFAMIVFSIATIGIGLLVTIPGFILLFLGWIALTLMGTIKAANSESYRYPLTIRFVK